MSENENKQTEPSEIITDPPGNNNNDKSSKGLVIGLCLGITIGLTTGMLREDIFLWTTRGLVIGLCFGTAYDCFGNKKNSNADISEEQKDPENAEDTEG